jgi:hypothetical protein
MSNEAYWMVIALMVVLAIALLAPRHAGHHFNAEYSAMERIDK